MKKLMNAKMVNENELDSVNGGDWGDTAWENNNHRNMYHIGDEVEVYSSLLHNGTDHGKITAMKRDFANENFFDFSKKKCYMYYVEFEGAFFNTDGWFTANLIKSK